MTLNKLESTFSQIFTFHIMLEERKHLVRARIKLRNSCAHHYTIAPTGACTIKLYGYLFYGKGEKLWRNFWSSTMQLFSLNKAGISTIAKAHFLNLRRKLILKIFSFSVIRKVLQYNPLDDNFKCENKGRFWHPCSSLCRLSRSRCRCRRQKQEESFTSAGFATRWEPKLTFLQRVSLLSLNLPA